MIERFHLDQAARRLEGRADRTPAQKDRHDAILRKGEELATLIAAAGGDSDETGKALALLDEALDEASWALVPIAAEAG